MVSDYLLWGRLYNFVSQNRDKDNSIVINCRYCSHLLVFLMEIEKYENLPVNEIKPFNSINYFGIKDNNF